MIMNPTAIKHVVVDGHSLTLESFVAIARYNATVELAPSALEAMKKSRALAEKIAAEGRVAYGITTGFGEFQKVAVPKELVTDFNMFVRPMAERVTFNSLSFSDSAMSR